MIEFFDANQHAFWFSAGFLILLIELGVFGLSSGVLLFTGLGALVTGALIWAGLLPATWLAGSASFGLSSGIISVLLWAPLRRLQRKRPPAKDNSSDFIGYRFRLEAPLNATTPASTRYSGIQWRVELDPHSAAESLEPGTLVEVRSLDAGVFRVDAAEPGGD